MRNKKPPFEITNTMIHQVAEIAELVGKLTSTNQLSTNPTLRRINRIRTIHGLSGHRAEHPKSGASHRSAKRQASAGFAQGYC